MIKNRLTSLITAALLATTIAASANETAAQAEVNPAPATGANIFDPNYWMGGFGAAQAPGSGKVPFNAAHPASWMKWADPKSHQSMHMAFANPATYTQFLQPQFYMEFARPENMAAWMDFNQYQVMTNPQTMVYWMNPGSYMHGFDPAMYQASMNPANYLALVNPATWTGARSCNTDEPNNTPTWFSYNC